MRRFIVILRRAKHIFQTEGLPSLLRQGVKFLNRGHLFHHETYYLYEHTLKERNEADFMPKTNNFTFKIVSSAQQVDELAAEGLDLDLYFIDARQNLDKGAIAFCIFIGRELAHIGWVAITEKAKKTFDTESYQVDFSNNEACTGGTWTHPRYRGRGLMVYGYFKRFQFLRERGITVSRNAVVTKNIISQRGHAKFGPKRYAKGHHLKILRWEFWKETPLTHVGVHLRE